MRIALLVLVCLFAVSRASSADAIIKAQGSESFVDYGDSPALHMGMSFFQYEATRDGVTHVLDWYDVGTEFAAEAGPLLSKKFKTDSSGNIVETIYEYDGGLFSMWFGIFNKVTGETRFGTFHAPILGPLTLTVFEADFAFGDQVTASYKLGAGMFDANVADAFGVGRLTKGGSIYDPWLTYGSDDPSMDFRYASEGAPDVEILVPEPGSLVLLGVSGFCLLARARRNP